MVHRARLAWRSPPRFSRWRVTLPEEASSGETPHRWAQAASESQAFGVVAGGHEQGGCRVDADAIDGRAARERGPRGAG